MRQGRGGEFSEGELSSPTITAYAQEITKAMERAELISEAGIDEEHAYDRYLTVWADVEFQRLEETKFKSATLQKAPASLAKAARSS